MMSDEREFLYQTLLPAYERAERECTEAVARSREVAEKLRAMHGREVRVEDFPVYAMAAGIKDDALKRCSRLHAQVTAIKGPGQIRFAEFYRWLAARRVTADYANFERDLANFYLC